jgi:hypothetical protein
MPTSEAWSEIESIKQLKARYFRMMDTKNWKGYRDVFTDDLKVRVEISVGKPGAPAQTQPDIPTGGDAYVAWLEPILAAATTVHHGHMPEIKLIDPEHASGVWSMEDIVGFPDGRLLRGYGHYHETYRKVGGEWRIATLNLTRLRLDETEPG